MQSQVHTYRNTPAASNHQPMEHTCHCAFAIYANIPVTDERGRYCSACGHYEFAADPAVPVW